MLYGYQGLLKNSVFNKSKKNQALNQVKMNLQGLLQIYKLESKNEEPVTLADLDVFFKKFISNIQ